MGHREKRWLCLCLALMLCVGMLPVAALAAPEETPLASEEPVSETSQEPTQEPTGEPVETAAPLAEETAEKPVEEPTAETAALAMEGGTEAVSSYTMGTVASVSADDSLTVQIGQAAECYYVYATEGLTLNLTLASSGMGGGPQTKPLNGLKNGSFVSFDGHFRDNVTVTIAASGNGSFALYTLDQAKTAGYIPAIKPGDTVSLAMGESRAYAFTAEQTGYYFFSGTGASLTVTPSAEGRTPEMSCFFLKADESVYFILSGNVEGGATLTFGSLSGNALETISDGNAKLEASKYYGYTPTQTGLYLPTVNEGNVMLLDPETGKRGNIANSSANPMELKAGVTYILRADSELMLSMKRAEPSSATPLVLDETATADTQWELYSFTPQTSGFYTLTAENVSDIRLYNGNGLQTLARERDEEPATPPVGGSGGGNAGGGDTPPSKPVEKPATYIVALAAGETAYFIASSTAQGGEMKLTLSASDTSSFKTITAGKHLRRDLSLGVYVFTAEKSGMYCLSGASATITALENGNTKTAYENSPALFYLEKGKQAVIALTDEFTELTLGLLNEAFTPLELALDAQTQVYSDRYATQFFAYFTAPADGLYVVKMPEKNDGGATRVSFMDNRLRQYDRRYKLDETNLCCSFVCNLKKGETVYLWGGTEHTLSPDANRNEIDQLNTAYFTVESTTVYGALGEIDSSTAVATTDETRASVQTLGTDNLTEAMYGSESAAIAERLATLEAKLDDGECESVTTSEAGVSSVSIIGALFNTLTGETGEVTLTVASGEEQPLPASSALSEESAVYLQMQLDGVEDAAALAVPVYLTVAVPENMDAQRVRLVHYGAGGTEVLAPVSVYSEAGAWYARFVAGGFSPFALAELAADESAATGETGKTSPQTGDEGALVLWLALAGLGGIGLVSAGRKKRAR